MDAGCWAWIGPKFDVSSAVKTPYASLMNSCQIGPIWAAGRPGTVESHLAGWLAGWVVWLAGWPGAVFGAVWLAGWLHCQT